MQAGKVVHKLHYFPAAQLTSDDFLQSKIQARMFIGKDVCDFINGSSVGKYEANEVKLGTHQVSEFIIGPSSPLI